MIEGLTAADRVAIPPSPLRELRHERLAAAHRRRAMAVLCLPAAIDDEMRVLLRVVQPPLAGAAHDHEDLLPRAARGSRSSCTARRIAWTDGRSSSARCSRRGAVEKVLEW